MRIFFALLFSGILSVCVAQESGTTDEKNGSTGKKGEIVLDDILIEGKVEKPNVMIMPNRQSSQFAESDFPERSFIEEIVRVPPRAVLFDKNFDKLQRVDALNVLLKKLLAKQKEGNSK